MSLHGADFIRFQIEIKATICVNLDNCIKWRDNYSSFSVKRLAHQVGMSRNPYESVAIPKKKKKCNPHTEKGQNNSIIKKSHLTSYESLLDAVLILRLADTAVLTDCPKLSKKGLGYIPSAAKNWSVCWLQSPSPMEYGAELQVPFITASSPLTVPVLMRV